MDGTSQTTHNLKVVKGNALARVDGIRQGPLLQESFVSHTEHRE